MAQKQEWTGSDVSIELPSEGIALNGTLTVPQNVQSIVVFVHGSGSSRFSPRNQYVAKFLNSQGIATLLTDLLTPDEEAVDELTRQFRFDIPLLTRRLLGISEWVRKQPETKKLKIGYFGSSTGAAGALIAAAQEGDKVYAVVSRGGRPDLAAQVLNKVTAPTLLIVGGDDFGVIELNQQAFDLLNSKKKLEIVPGATHLFEEPGKLEEVAKLAAAWFKKV